MMKLRLYGVGDNRIFGFQVFCLVLMLSFKSLCGYVAPLQNIDVWLDDKTVFYKVFDPVQNKWEEDSESWGTQLNPVTVYNEDGIVAFVEASFTGNDWVRTVNIATYDPVLKRWQKKSFPGLDNVPILKVKDGVVAFVEARYVTNDWYRTTHYATYDAVSNRWETGSKSVGSSNIDLFDVDDGIVMFLENKYSSSGWTDIIHYYIYDSEIRSWRSGSRNEGVTFISGFGVVDGQVNWKTSSHSRNYGYDGSWGSGKQTDSVASFAYDDSPGESPTTTWFTDMSMNATSWSWLFGDGQSSSQPSPYHTFEAPGLYTVTLNINGPGGNSYHSQVISTDFSAPSGSVLVD